MPCSAHFSPTAASVILTRVQRSTTKNNVCLCLNNDVKRKFNLFRMAYCYLLILFICAFVTIIKNTTLLHLNRISLHVVDYNVLV